MTIRLISYQLIIEVTSPLILDIGALKRCSFPVGIYVYTGSAKTNLDKRIQRHLSPEKRLRWHVDYLLAAPDAKIIKVIKSPIAECRLNQATLGEILIKGFGSSDCRSGCDSHLKYQAPVNAELSN